MEVADAFACLDTYIWVRYPHILELTLRSADTVIESVLCICRLELRVGGDSYKFATASPQLSKYALMGIRIYWSLISLKASI
jgi:hypothetical protein